MDDISSQAAHEKLYELQISCPDKNKEGLLSSLSDEISLLTQVKQQVEEAIARSVSQGLTASFSNCPSAPSAASFESVGVSALSDTDSCEGSKSSGRKGSDGAVLMSPLCDSVEQGSVKQEVLEDEEGYYQDQEPDIAQGSDLNSNWADMRKQDRGDLGVIAGDILISDNEGENDGNGDAGATLEGADLATFESSL